MSPLHRRLCKLEAKHPKRVSGQMIEFACLSPEVQALWLDVDSDLNLMTLAGLDLLATDLRRFTV